jgi:glycosyltransferase involved in cell wall biosynthesis
MRLSIVTGFFLPVPAVAGGATEKTWHSLAGRFAAAGHAVTFVSRSRSGLPEAAVEAGVRHLRLPGFDHTRSLPLNLALDFLWGVRVARALPPADAVICNTVTLPAWLPRVKPSAGRVAVMIGRVPKGQVRAYGRVARLYVPSTFVADRLGAERASGRLRVIGYPVDWARLAGASAQAGAPIVLSYIGRLHPEKGLALLVDAACLLSERAGLPAWRLRLVGPTATAEGGGEAWVQSLRERAAHRLGQRIEWLPAEFEADRLARLYGTTDVFCYPSVAVRGETFGVAVAEAMAARCAVVVSALDCFRDLVTDGETGLVVDHAGPGAAARLADTLARLISDPALRTGLAGRGQDHVRRFDTDQVARAVLDDLSVLTGAGRENQLPSARA